MEHHCTKVFVATGPPKKAMHCSARDGTVFQEASQRPEPGRQRPVGSGETADKPGCGQAPPPLSARLRGAGHLFPTPAEAPGISKGSTSHPSSPAGEPRGQGSRPGSGARGKFTFHPRAGSVPSVLLSERTGASCPWGVEAHLSGFSRGAPREQGPCCG